MSVGKVIGYFAYFPNGHVFCDGPGCIIAGSRKKMERYIRQKNPGNLKGIIIKKTTFGEIMKGMNRGAAYSFDVLSYSRFCPLANKNGMNVDPDEFTKEPPPNDVKNPIHLVQIRKYRGID